MSCMEKIWYKYSKIVNITKYSKAWWDENCHRDLVSYASPLIWKYIPAVKSPSNIQACLLWQLPFLQHILGQYCNPLGIPSSIVGILLFNLVFHDRVTPVSVSTLKP